MNYSMEIGDVFNETDSDTDRIIIGKRYQKNPPMVLIRPMKCEDDSDESTEEEYVEDYAEICVKFRKEYEEKRLVGKGNYGK